jgi:hypothetical protein
VGASASAGFTISEPFGGTDTARHRLYRYVDAALVAAHEPVTNLASTLFFLQPETVGRNQIELALQIRPTLLVGADFLFWFCYGNGDTDQERLGRFEQGLKLLEAIRCPIVLGDIPDCSAAVNGMLSPEQIPSPTTIAAANRRLKEWARSRPRVAILSISGFMRTVLANQALSVHGFNLPAGETRILLQEDNLHPSPPGCAVLALALLDTFQATRPLASAGEVRWNPKEVYRLALKPSSASAPSVPKVGATNAPVRTSPTRSTKERDR